MPGAPFIAAAFVCFLAEMTHQRLKGMMAAAAEKAK